MAIAGRDSYDNAVSLKKNIQDKLHYVQTVDCPLFDSMRGGKAKGSIHYFNEVAYVAPTASDSRIEGYTLADETPPTEVQYTTYTEINSQGWTVSTTMQDGAKNGGTVGTSDEIARLKTEALEKLKMQNEWAIINGTTNAGANTPTARDMTGLIKWADSGYTANTALATLGVASAGEANWKAFLIALKAVGGLRGRKKVALMSWSNKQTISGWNGITDTVNADASGKKIYSYVDLYDSMMGTIMLKGHDLYPETSIVVFDPEIFRTMFLSNTKKRKLGTVKLGDSYHYYNEFATQYDKPKTLGRLNLTS